MTKVYTCFDLTIDEQSIAHLQFTRPELHNRFDEPAHREFAELVLALSSREDIRAMIISAQGRSWSAGGDLAMITRQNDDKPFRDRIAWEARTIFEGFIALPFPVIGAVHGAAIGLGATLVALCDIIVACHTTRIGDPHVDLGLVAGDGGIVAWSQAIGVTRAKRYLLTGEPIDGKQAYAMGLVTDLVETADDVYPAARAIAQTIAAKPSGGVIGTKRAFAQLTKQIASPAFELGLRLEMETIGGPEVLEAVRAILDRKK